MGGFGSGRHGGRVPRSTTDECFAIDVRRWQREKLLTGRSFSIEWARFGQVVATLAGHREVDHLHLIYRHRSGGDGWKTERSTVHLDWTRCHYGGRRPWFQCPHCWRRVAVLHGSTTLACRRCFGLAYGSTREGKAQRAGRRAEKIRARLKWRPGILWGVDRKPPGMHWDTFFKLAGQAAELTSLALAPTLRRLGIRSNL